MRKLILPLAVLGILLVIAAGVFIFWFYPQKLRPEQEYQSAVALHRAGDHVPAALQFEGMKGYKDSAALAKEAWLRAGEKSFENGDLAQARTYYLKAGADSGQLAKLDSAYYQMGVRAYADNQRVEAENCFSCISAGSSYLDLLDPVRISSAGRFLNNADYDSAQKVFRLCRGSSYGEIARLWIESGEKRLEAFDIDNASYCFAKAMAYTDDTAALTARLDALWEQAGHSARTRGDTALAAKCFSRMSSGGEMSEEKLAADYERGVEAYDNGDYAAALKCFGEAGDYSDARERFDSLCAALENSLSAKGPDCWARLDPKGRVSLEGDWGAFSDPAWDDITAIAVGGSRFMLGLAADGSVRFHGNSSFGNAEEVASWQNVIAVACGENHSAALKSDGTVLSCGPDTFGEVSGTAAWQGVKAISAGSGFTAALMDDGTVAACGLNASGQCDTAGLEGVTAIACGGKHLVMLKADGKVAAVGDNSFGQCDVSSWTDVVRIFAGADHTAAVTSDGRLLACGNNDRGQCAVQGIEGVICAACGDGFTIVLTSDGATVRLGA